MGGASSVSDVWTACVLWDPRRRLELLCGGRWPNQFGLAPGLGSAEFARPSRTPEEFRIAGRDRGNCEWFRFRYRDHFEAGLLDYSDVRTGFGVTAGILPR